MRPYFTNNEVGFFIGEVNSPREIPLDSDLRLVIDAIQHDVDFVNKYSLRSKVMNNIKE